MALTRFLDHSRARTIAENDWGRGGTTSYRTNRRGAFYFSCSGHGGFVIDAACLTDEERAAFDKHLTMETGTAFIDDKGKVRKVAHTLMRRTVRYRSSWRSANIGFYLAEEDCAWSIPAVAAGIFAHHENQTEEQQLAHARSCFSRWYANKEVA